MKNKDEYTEFIWIESGNSKIYFYKLVSILYKRVIEDSYESKGSLSLWEKSYDRREDSSWEKKKKWGCWEEEREWQKRSMKREYKCYM